MRAFSRTFGISGGIASTSPPSTIPITQRWSPLCRMTPCMTRRSRTRLVSPSRCVTRGLCWWADGRKLTEFSPPVVHLITDGQGFQPGDTSDEVLTRYEVRFGAVSEARRLTLLTYADWANRRGPFDAIQLILPDSNGRWPDDSHYDSYPQPLLDRV
jgi:Domain of unknown function (DUF4262)